MALPRVYPVKVAIEDLLGHPTPIPAYTDGSRWNGWACPWFTRDEAMKIVEAFNERKADSALYDKEHDAFLFAGEEMTLAESEEYDMVDVYESQQVEVAIIGPVGLYPIGNGGWVWEIVEDETPLNLYDETSGLEGRHHEGDD